MISLPFRIRGVRTNLIDLEGIARLEEKDLCLEFTLGSVFVRHLRSKPREVRIPLDVLEEAVFKHRLCIGMLDLRARSLSAFAGVPGAGNGLLRLRCRREYWGLAQEMASRLSLRKVQDQIRDMVAETDRATQSFIQAPSPPPTEAPGRERRPSTDRGRGLLE